MIVPKRKPNGRWAVRWREGGRQRQQTFDRKAVAEAFATRLNDRLQSHGLVDLDRGRMTVAEFMETYWADYAIPNLTPNTREVYKRVWGKHLLPRVGAWELREVTPKRLSAMRAGMERGGVGAPTILKAFTVLQSLLSYAVVEEQLERNPAREVRKPSQAREREIVIATPEQVEAVRAYLLDPPRRRDTRGRLIEERPLRQRRQDAMIVSLLAYAGLRTFSEIHSREWRHVGARALQVYASKTNRAGVVRLLAPLSQDLAEWRLASGRPAPRAPLIARPDGRPLVVTDWRNWRRRVFRPAAEAVGLVGEDGHGIHPYDLRHAFASLLIWEGQSLAQVAEQLRHSVMTCSRTYIHILEEYSPEGRVSAEERIRAARGEQRRRAHGG